MDYKAEKAAIEAKYEALTYDLHRRLDALYRQEEKELRALALRNLDEHEAVRLLRQGHEIIKVNEVWDEGDYYLVDGEQHRLDELCEFIEEAERLHLIEGVEGVGRQEVYRLAADVEAAL